MVKARQSEIDELVAVWKNYFYTVADWQLLVQGVIPKKGGCGLIYDLGNPTNRQNEDCAIADMRHLAVAEPHFHPSGELEVYYVLQGNGLLVLGGEEQRIYKDSVVVIPPMTAHFTIPDTDLVIAAVNKPAFKSEGYIVLTESNKDVGFDKEQFERLTAGK